MLKPEYTTKFDKDLKKISKRNLNLQELKNVITKLINEVPLEPKYRDHCLTGDYNHYRECHIKPNWLLIYRIFEEENTIKFIRTGSHSDLFE